jgi:hypothetical protein
MFPLAIVLGSVGVILLLAGLVGGFFTFLGPAMPKFGTIARVLRLPLAGLLVLSAISITLLDPSAQALATTSTQSSTTSTLSAAAKAVSATYSADQDTDRAVIVLLRGRSSFQGQTDANLIDASKSACLLLAHGDRASDILAVATNAGISADDAAYFLAVAVEAYCPTYRDLAIATAT